MKKILKILLIILSYAPIATVAAAAQAKANEMRGEEQNDILLKSLRAARYRLIPTGSIANTIENAKARYAKITGLNGEHLEKKMAEDIELLKQSGLIQNNETLIVSGTPSEHAF